MERELGRQDDLQYKNALQKVRYSESADQLFKRARTPPFHADLPLFSREITSGGLRPGDVVEFYGASGSGKTEMLYHILVHCILPIEWKGVAIGGSGIGVVYLDNEHKFCVFRVASMIEARLRIVIQQSVEGTGVLLSGSDIEEILKESLQRVNVVRCTDTFQLFATLRSLDPLLSDASENIRVLMLDNIGAFFNADRYTEEKSRKSKSAKIPPLLRTLTIVHNLILFVTKPLLFGGFSRYELQNSGAMVHKEYMSEQYERMVRYRIALLREKRPAYAVAQFQSVPPFVYYACFIHPPALLATTPTPNTPSRTPQHYQHQPAQRRLLAFQITDEGISMT